MDVLTIPPTQSQNQLFDYIADNTLPTVLGFVDMEIYNTRCEAKAITNDRKCLANRALEAEKEIARAIRYLNNMLDEIDILVPEGR